VADNAVVAHARGASTDSRDQILRKLKKLDRQNSGSSGGTRKPALRQNRNRRMAGLLKQLYGWKCQLCGLKLASPDARRHDIHVHHLDGWDGLRSDRLSNLVCVCPNHHALLGLGALQFREGRLLEWTDGAWVERKLEVDFHLGNAAGD
jgi:predicted HNH restriction endonuclease